MGALLLGLGGADEYFERRTELGFQWISSDKILTANGAERYCKQHFAGSHLASVHNDAEMAVFKEMCAALPDPGSALDKTCWLGTFDSDPDDADTLEDANRDGTPYDYVYGGAQCESGRLDKNDQHCGVYYLYTAVDAIQDCVGDWPVCLPPFLPVSLRPSHTTQTDARIRSKRMKIVHGKVAKVHRGVRLQARRYVARWLLLGVSESQGVRAALQGGAQRGRLPGERRLLQLGAGVRQGRLLRV